MADVLIRGMEMPKTCNDCPLHELFFAFGKQNIVCSPTGHALGGIDEKHLKESRNSGYCPLVEVTDHGRLIDAKALKQELTTSGIVNTYGTQVLMKIDSSKTVIPASGKEKE